MDTIFVDFISKKRTEIMGCAMIAVLLYHMFCWPKPFYYLLLFRYGYIGVDVFMFLAGYGLVYSFRKYDLITFYKRRLLRIAPLYWLEVLIVIVIGILLNYKPMSIIEALFTFLSLGVYGVGGWLTNWFVGAIVFFYAFFPLLYCIAQRYPVLLVAFSNILSLLILHHYNLGWQWDCMISRVPVFILGIVVCIFREEKNKLIPPIYISLMTFVISLSYNVSIYLSAASITPILLCCMSYFRLFGTLHTVYGQFFSWLKFVGKNSWVLFTSNGVVGRLIMCFNHYYPELVHIYIIVPMYVLGTFFWGWVFYVAASKTEKMLLRFK